MPFSRLSWGLVPLLALASPLAAQEAMPGADIAALVGGKTVEGSMMGTGPYAEFYEEGGTIRGDGYTGAWTVEGDAMCFDYGDDPATCYGVAADGVDLAWITDGEVVGTGTLVEGNARGF